MINMVGIPKNLNTKRDVTNLQQMAKENLIDRKEWTERLKEMTKEDMFPIPVLEKGEGYFIIPKTERELPAIYSAVPMVIPETEGTPMETEVFKITGEAPESGFVELNGGYQEAERLELTQEEIKKMIEELM